MKYQHIANYVSETPWAILRTKLDEIVAILEFHCTGGKFTPEELRARIGDGARPADIELVAAAERGGGSAPLAVAVIPVQGVIAHRMGSLQEMSGGVSTERLSALLKQAANDPQVGSIVLDVNSPGGTVAGVTELAALVRSIAAKKPVTAHVNALAASAAYWAISGATEIVATPSGEVGAIGVITAHVDTSKAEADQGITTTVIAAGKYKAEGTGPLSDEAKAAIQDRVNGVYATMTADIAKGRGVSVGEVRSGFGEGRVVSASDALAMGMIDRIATFDETLRSLTTGRGAVGLKGENHAPALVASLPSADPDADRTRRLRLL